MALSFDDKILGEKVDYYCSSSDEEKEEELKNEGEINVGPQLERPPLNQANTGPKGVIEDWREFIKMEREKREEEQNKRIRPALQCRTVLEDELEKERELKYELDLKNLNVGEDDDDDFLQKYRELRMMQMRQNIKEMPKFGKVRELDKSSFLDSIDKENKQTTIILLIYRNGNKLSEKMKVLLNEISRQFQTTKFCTVEVSTLQMSINFSISGVPAILVYKAGEVVGSFVGLSNEFEDYLHSDDLVSFLVEHGMLPEEELQNTSSIKGTNYNNNKNKNNNNINNNNSDSDDD